MSMEKPENSPFSLIPEDPERTEPMSEHLCLDNALAQEVAMSLFDSDIVTAAMTWRRGKRSTRLHYNSSHRLMLHLQGEMTIQLGNRLYDLKPGDLVYCAPGTAFQYMGTEEIAYWAYFYINPTPFWESLATDGSYVRPYESARLMYLLLRRILDAHRDRGGRSLSRARGDARMLRTVLMRLRRHPPQKLDDRAVKLREVVHEISHSPAEAWTTKLMMERLHVSESTLLRLCRERHDLSPKEIIISERLKVAAMLLAQSSEPISAIAASVGYQSVYSFSRIFSKSQGMPPGRYRQTRRRMELDEELPPG